MFNLEAVVAGQGDAEADVDLVDDDDVQAQMISQSHPTNVKATDAVDLLSSTVAPSATATTSTTAGNAPTETDAAHPSEAKIGESQSMPAAGSLDDFMQDLTDAAKSPGPKKTDASGYPDAPPPPPLPAPAATSNDASKKPDSAVADFEDFLSGLQK